MKTTFSTLLLSFTIFFMGLSQEIMIPSINNNNNFDGAISGIQTNLPELNQNETVSDFDGNIYNTVTIGSQIWLNENLKSLHYSDGSEITEVWAYDDNETFAAIYGRLYSWNGAMNYSTTEKAQGVCPNGWHIPSDDEWTELGRFLGGNNIAGGKLKETGNEHWQEPNTGATNESEFTALGAGEYDDTHYQLLNEFAVFWSSTETSATKCKYRYLSYEDAELHTYNYYKDFRYSVRCLNNSTVGFEDHGSMENKVKITPNPANTSIFIKYSGIINFPVNIEFHNITGRLLKTEKVNSLNNNIDISSLPPGMYFISIEINSELIIGKFIKK